jgi:hypothetical protein
MRLVQVQVLRVREFDSRPLLIFVSAVACCRGVVILTADSCLYSSVAERSTCNAQVRNSILRAGFFLTE